MNGKAASLTLEQREVRIRPCPKSERDERILILKEHGIPAAKLAEMFGISEGRVYDICRGARGSERPMIMDEEDSADVEIVKRGGRLHHIDSFQFLRLVDDARIHLTKSFLCYSEGDILTANIHLVEASDAIEFIQREFAKKARISIGGEGGMPGKV